MCRRCYDDTECPCLGENNSKFNGRTYFSEVGFSRKLFTVYIFKGLGKISDNYANYVFS